MLLKKPGSNAFSTPARNCKMPAYACCVHIRVKKTLHANWIQSLSVQTYGVEHAHTVFIEPLSIVNSRDHHDTIN